jgi:hypothetical protein
VASAKDATGHHRDQRAALLALVAPLSNHHGLRSAADLQRAPLLALAQAVPPQPDPSPRWPTRHATRRTSPRTCLLCRWLPLEPGLDVEPARDDPLLASVSPVFSHCSVAGARRGSAANTPPSPSSPSAPDSPLGTRRYPIKEKDSHRPDP